MGEITKEFQSGNIKLQIWRNKAVVDTREKFIESFTLRRLYKKGNSEWGFSDVFYFKDLEKIKTLIKELEEHLKTYNPNTVC